MKKPARSKSSPGLDLGIRPGEDVYESGRQHGLHALDDAGNRFLRRLATKDGQSMPRKVQRRDRVASNGRMASGVSPDYSAAS